MYKRDKLHQRILDAARLVNDVAVLHKATLTVFERGRICIHADCVNCEYSLNLIAQPYLQ
jgi:hypothetical protein